MPGANCIDFANAQPSSQTIVGLDNTTSPSATLPTFARGCIITVEDVPIRWRADGTNPTTGVGHYIAANGSLTFDSWSSPGNNWKSVMKTIKFCGSSATSTLAISYFD